MFIFISYGGNTIHEKLHGKKEQRQQSKGKGLESRVKGIVLFCILHFTRSRLISNSFPLPRLTFVLSIVNTKTSQLLHHNAEHVTLIG